MFNRAHRNAGLIKRYNGLDTKPSRVFFAIFPDKFARAQLTYQAEQLVLICGGNPVRAQRIHLTLLFLGNIAAHRIGLLQQSMKNIAVKKFEFQLEEICYWKKNRIVYGQAKQFPTELFILVDSLKTTLSEAGLLIEKNIYKPHVTLVRQAIYSTNINLTLPLSGMLTSGFLCNPRKPIAVLTICHWVNGV
jgi:2'-5' RNA ligase